MKTIARLILSATLLLISASLLAQDATKTSPTSSSPVLAEVGGHQLTEADLEQKKAGSLLQARYTYYLSQRKALDQLVDDELLAIEAQRRKVTVEQLLNSEIYKDIKDPTDDQMQVYYEGTDSQEPYEAVRSKILDHIRDLRRDRARAAFIKNLRAEAKLRIWLEPPSAAVNLEDANMRGSKDAEVLLVEFADYECPYCEKINPVLQKLKDEYGDKLTLVYKDFPLPMHRRAQKAAEAARCAGEQGKFWEYHDVLYYSRLLDINELKKHAQVLRLDEARFNKCLDNGQQAEAVKKDLEEAKKLGLTGTPSFFFNGRYMSGAPDYSALREMVEQQLARSQRAVTQTASRK